jgi:HEAT repeat protein
MRLAAGIVIGLALVTGTGAWQGQSAPAPQIQNGKVEVRKGTAIDREIASLAPARADEPVWIAWRAPMTSGDRDMCAWYGDRLGMVRGMFVDDAAMAADSTSNPRPQITAPTGPIPLESGTQVVMLARVIDRKVERLRTVGDDCPMDAGGRTVYWLDGITPAESLRFLGSLVAGAAPDRSLVDAERILAQAAVRAIGYHRDAGADTALDQIATSHRDANVRRQAASTMGSQRGAAGVAVLQRLIDAEKDADARRQLVASLGGSRDASAVTALRALTKDPEVKVRSEAVYYTVLRGGAPTIPEAVRIAGSDPDDSVRKRAVTAIGRLAPDVSTAPLIQLARTSTNAVVRKEAVSLLSTSKDPRAMAFMDELLKRESLPAARALPA